MTTRPPNTKTSVVFAADTQTARNDAGHVSASGRVKTRPRWLGVVACVPCRHSLSSPAHATYRASLPALRSGRPRAPTDSNRESASGGTRVPALTASLRRHGEAQERAGTACPSKRPPRTEPTARHRDRGDTDENPPQDRAEPRTRPDHRPDLRADL